VRGGRLHLSALKDFLVPSGGLILTRDRGAYQKAAMQAFIDGAQLSGGAMELWRRRCAIFLRGLIRDRPSRTGELSLAPLERRCPLTKPAAGHAVFVDVKAFLPHLSAAQFPAEALAAFIYHMSGIRLTKGPPPARASRARR